MQQNSFFDKNLKSTPKMAYEFSKSIELHFDVNQMEKKEH